MVYIWRRRSHCVSGTVSAIEGLLTTQATAFRDSWRYYDIIRTHMPQNCSRDVQRVTEHIDRVFTSGNETSINEVKGLFNMNVSHLDDFVSARKSIQFLRMLHPPTALVLASEGPSVRVAGH